MTSVTIPSNWDSLHGRLRASARVALAVTVAFATLASLTQRQASSVAHAADVDAALLHAASAAAGRSLPVIVRERVPSTSQAEDAVRAAGGAVTRELPIVRGFAARLPGSALRSLAGEGSITDIWGDAHITMSSSGTTSYDAWDPNIYWRRGIRLGQLDGVYDGTGVTVALLDTGVARTPDLGARVLARVDFTPGGAGDDVYGHGSHMAGVIAGDGGLSGGKWRGVATGARLVSVKVAGPDGATDVSIVIAALQWIVAHRDAYDIRVLNLSFGTDSVQPYRLDPLDYAVERAWFAGIFVVVAAGNRGSADGMINKPGDDPFVMTVGAADLNGTPERSDDSVAPFSSRGPTADGFEKPDVVAPGITIVSSRVADSTVDQLHPGARVGESYFKGTGTSQAAAIVSGVAALMLQADPRLSPDMLKAIVMATAYKPLSYRDGGGAGLIDAAGAVYAAQDGTYTKGPANANLAPSTGSGSLEASRGSFHVYADLDGDGQPELVSGETDVLGRAWTSTSWSSTSWSGTSWSSLVAENDGWDSTSWSSTSWEGVAWTSTSWGSTSWGSTSWSSTSWSSTSWSSTTWS